MLDLSFSGWLHTQEPTVLSENERLSALCGMVAAAMAFSGQGLSPSSAQDVALLREANPEFAQLHDQYQCWFATLDWSCSRHDYQEALNDHWCKPLVMPWLLTALASNPTAQFALQLSVVLFIADMDSATANSPVGQKAMASVTAKKRELLMALAPQEPFDPHNANDVLVDFLEHWQQHHGHRNLHAAASTFEEVYNALHPAPTPTSSQVWARRQDSVHGQRVRNAMFGTLIEHVKHERHASVSIDLPQGWMETP